MFPQELTTKKNEQAVPAAIEPALQFPDASLELYNQLSDSWSKNYADKKYQYSSRRRIQCVQFVLKRGNPTRTFNICRMVVVTYQTSTMDRFFFRGNISGIMHTYDYMLVYCAVSHSGLPSNNVRNTY